MKRIMKIVLISIVFLLSFITTFLILSPIRYAQGIDEDSTSLLVSNYQAPGDTPIRAPNLRYQNRDSVDVRFYEKVASIMSETIVPVDIVFTIDNTGSMCGTIDTVKSNVQVIADGIRAEVPDSKFGSIKFRDYGDAFITEIVTQPTSDVSVFKSGINTMYCGGGADWPEAYVETIFQGVNDVVWRDNALKLLVVLGDAPPHDPIYGTGVSGSGHTWAEAATVAANAGVPVSMVAVGYGVGNSIIYNSYNYMAGATGGRYVESSDPTEVTNALIDLINELSNEKPMVISTNPASGADSVPIDTTIYATFNMDMDASTINASTIILDAGYYCLLVPITYDAATRTVSIDPYGLDAGHTYKVVMGNGIKSSSGVFLSNYQWSFDTVPLSPREKVINKLNDFRYTARETMELHRDLLAGNIYRGLKAMSSDQLFSFSKTVVELVVTLPAGGRGLFGPGTKGITSGFRTAIEVSRGLDALDTWRQGYQLFIADKHWDQLATIAPDNPFDPPPSFQACKGLLDKDYAFYEFNGINAEPEASFYGIIDALEMVDEIVDNAIAKIPADISEDEAGSIKDFLDSRISILQEAREIEVAVANTGAGSLTCELIILGRITTWGEMLDWGIEWLPAEEGAKLVGTLTKAAGAFVKIGGIGTSWTGLSLGAVAWGDIMIFGTSGVELGWEYLAGVELSPIDTINYAVLESEAAFNDEILSQIFYLQDAVDYVNQKFSPTSFSFEKSLNAYLTVANASEGLDITNFSVPPLDLSVSSTGTAEVTVKNVSFNSYQIKLLGTVLGPPTSKNGPSIVSLIEQDEMTELLPGSTKTLKITYGAPGTMLFGPEGFMISLALVAINKDTSKVSTLGPYVARLIAGTTEEIELANLLSAKTIISGVVSPGNRHEAMFYVTESLQSLVLSLIVSYGADANLHIFDSDGKHVGINYSTGLFENDIPGSTYSGTQPKVEYIRINSPAKGIYVLRVVGQSGPASFSVSKVEVPLLPAVVATDRQVVCSGFPGEVTETSIVVREVGGAQDITELNVLAGSLTDDYGNFMNAENVALGLYDNTIRQGEGILIPLTINIPEASSIGVYRGIITVESSAGSREISLELRVLEMPCIEAVVDIKPDVLNPKSKGNWVTSYIELPEGYAAENIDVSTVTLEGIISAESSPTQVGDHDDDGIPDLMVKFDRQTLIGYLGEATGEVTLTLTGDVDGKPFEGSDTIIVLGKKKKKNSM